MIDKRKKDCCKGIYKTGNRKKNFFPPETCGFLNLLLQAPVLFARVELRPCYFVVRHLQLYKLNTTQSQLSRVLQPAQSSSQREHTSPSTSGEVCGSSPRGSQFKPSAGSCPTWTCRTQPSLGTLRNSPSFRAGNWLLYIGTDWSICYSSAHKIKGGYTWWPPSQKIKK